jgi:hypothetical protein
MLVMVSKQRVCLPRHGSLASGNHNSRQNPLGNEEALLAAPMLASDQMECSLVYCMQLFC